MIDAATNAFPIDLRHVTRRFGRRVAVDDLTLGVRRGATAALIGLNGAGKTTAIRMMVGLLAPHAGQIFIAGAAVPRDRDRMKLRVGYVPDRPTVYAWMRVREAIDFCRALQPNWNDVRCGKLLKAFNLDRDQRVKHLSKGMAAKLSLLLAACHEPEVLILDEPTSGLDPVAREEFYEGVLSVTTEREQTVLLSSHGLADVQRLADSVALMHKCRLLFHTPVDELLEKTKRIRAVLQEAGDALSPPPGLVRQEVRGREWLLTLENFSSDQVEFLRARNRIEHLDVFDVNLDDVFKDFVRRPAAQTPEKEPV